jgi:hypothetical protein
MKYLIVTLTCLAAFALGACGNDKEDAPAPTPDVATAADAVVEVSDAENADAAADAPVEVDVENNPADTATAE